MRRDLEELGNDLRSARLAAGLTLAEVGRAIGSSPQTVLRVERPAAATSSPYQLARQAAAVGMRLRIKAYPEGPPIRDAAQVRLIREFRARIGGAGLRLEQPVTDDPADRRAFDATIDLPGGCGLEFISRFYDCQAQLRSALLKQRDANVLRLVIVVRATHANRRAVAAVGDILETSFAIAGRAATARLARGEDPGGNALIFV